MRGSPKKQRVINLRNVGKERERKQRLSSNDGAVKGDQKNRQGGRRQPEFPIKSEKHPNGIKGGVNSAPKKLSERKIVPLYNRDQENAYKKEGKKKKSTTQMLLGCCIFLLIILIIVAGTATLFARRAVSIFQEKSGQGIIEYLDQKYGDTIEQRLDDGIMNSVDEVIDAAGQQAKDSALDEAEKQKNDLIEDAKDQAKDEIDQQATEEVEGAVGNFNIKRR